METYSGGIFIFIKFSICHKLCFCFSILAPLSFFWLVCWISVCLYPISVKTSDRSDPILYLPTYNTLSPIRLWYKKTTVRLKLWFQMVQLIKNTLKSRQLWKLVIQFLYPCVYTFQICNVLVFSWSLKGVISKILFDFCVIAHILWFAVNTAIVKCTQTQFTCYVDLKAAEKKTICFNL